ncbi:hypothetical protein RRG08_048196 [Elysia crispata]|uniref:Uncharacterized protein n=1 Tax=Elysia crispata TaxID=231223 RepID=A0AAE1A3D8_9GAST|nr:hypothetical protein RRG08_048196 [Elysia crispata]
MCRTRTNGLQGSIPGLGNRSHQFGSWSIKPDRSVGDVSALELMGFRVQSLAEPSVLELEPSNLMSCPGPDRQISWRCVALELMGFRVQSLAEPSVLEPSNLSWFNPWLNHQFWSWSHQTCHVLDLTRQISWRCVALRLMGFRVQSLAEPSVLELGHEASVMSADLTDRSVGDVSH